MSTDSVDSISRTLTNFTKAKDLFKLLTKHAIKCHVNKKVGRHAKIKEGIG